MLQAAVDIAGCTRRALGGLFGEMRRLYAGVVALGFPDLAKEIVSLFGRLSSATVSRLKKITKDEMMKQNILSYGANKVNTRVAFDVWGLDVKDLESRMKKLKELNL